MFNNKEQRTTVAGGETVIAQGVKVEGNFSSKGDIIIDGELAGSLATSETLHVGQTAKIAANVKAKHAVIAGAVEGNIQIEGKLELLETSHVTGDIEAQVISVASGAQVNGRVSMMQPAGENVRAKKRESTEQCAEEPVLG